MSETLSQDPESLSSAGYATLTSYPPTPATPSSTVQDAPGGVNLPPFSTFSAEMDVNGAGFVSDRIFSDARLLDVSNWDYYTETRLLERGENGLSIIASQPQYRPWESKPVDSTSQDSLRQSFVGGNPVNTFAEAFAQNGVPKLPSFQSQFQSFNEAVTTSEPTTLTTLTNLTPVSPNSSPGGLTTLNSNFHTLSAVNPRNYPLVPAPIQAREIPSIQQQFLDERHIQLYTHPTTLTHPSGIFTHQNGTIIQNNQLISTPTVVTVLKTEHHQDLKLPANLQDLKVQNVGLHPTQFQNPMPAIIDNSMYANGLEKKINGMNAAMNSPTRNDFRKKERRKMRASSLESSAESDGASSNMEIGSENSGQVAAVSSTGGFKHHSMAAGNSGEVDDISGGNVDKQVKKKRKRCGECIGCQRKDNCGDCAPCRNDKSHQICKQRRCEKLTEKKNLYGDASYLRGESRRGRGKGRGAGSYRGRKPSGPVTALTGASTTVPVVPESSAGGLPPPSRPSPQPAGPAPVHMLKPEQPAQQQPMAPMPFYADPNRFTTPVWQSDGTQAWPQGQFIQQIPATAQPTLEGYTQQYPNGIYQTTYQQTPFDGSTFYTGAVQVLTNARPPSAPSHPQLTPRANGNYSHTPSPSSQQAGAPQRQYQQQEYQREYAPATTPTSIDNSRPNSVNSTVNTSGSNQSFSQQNGGTYTAVSSSNFSPSSSAGTNYVISNANGGSGNAKPGYPQVNSSPQLVSLNSSGYPGGLQSSGNESQNNWDAIMQQQSDNQVTWEGSDGSQMEQAYRDDEKEILDISQNQQSEPHFSQADRVNLNTRLKTMILNKQQNLANKLEEGQKLEENQTGHFLSYSHHHRLGILSDDGGKTNLVNRNNQHKYIHSPKTLPLPPQFKKHSDSDNSLNNSHDSGYSSPERNQHKTTKNFDDDDNHKTNVGLEIPPCNCFPTGNAPPEPGSYYTHLGCSSSLVNLRKDFEVRTGHVGSAIRIEKVCYTGKEGKTSQGCPLAKWIIRRSGYDEKFLIIAKHRKGHVCHSAFIVVCIVAWDGVVRNNADELYSMLTEKLNKFGLPTTRRCATNEPRTCACQGLDPDKCGASFSFGCSWSMYYNGCKFARSKVVRKFRLTEKTEEQMMEEKMQHLANNLSPLYRCLAPVSFDNQCKYEDYAYDCRLGFKSGRPFSGVTACLDFCAHAHKDSHNMTNGCTVVVTLTKNKALEKPSDEQLHVLPLYVVDECDEFGSQENQQEKVRNGSIEVLTKYHCEVRVRRTPLQPCRRANKKRKDGEEMHDNTKKQNVNTLRTKVKSEDLLQSNQVSSTVLDAPSLPYRYANNNPYYPQDSWSGYGVRNAYDYAPNPVVFKSPVLERPNTARSAYMHQNPTQIQPWGLPPNYHNGAPQQYYTNAPNQLPTKLPSFSQNFPNKHANFHYFYQPPMNYYYPQYNPNPFDMSSNLPNFYETNLSSRHVISDFKKPNLLGNVTDYTDNLECFRDAQVGGVAIALGHGSVLFECAKHELHATTALKKPDRSSPTRISLVFYQHRNLNRSKHGWEEYEDKMRMRKVGESAELNLFVVGDEGKRDVMLRAPTLPTVSVTTLFPMYPCTVTGPYQEKGDELGERIGC